MIAKISGILESVNLTEVIVDVNGIGYEIIIPLSTYDKLPRESEKVSFFTYLHVREDAMTLYGFATLDEKGLYKILISVSGIGPKLALKILSSISISSFCEAVSNGDIKTLMRINGLGKRSSERLIVELKDKIKTFAPETVYQSGNISKDISKQEEEAVLALVQLGFKYETARKSVMKISSSLSSEEANSENLIRKTLQSLNS
jgi:holliday junction DNA helicase RuvA